MSQTILLWDGRCTICGDKKDKTEFPPKKRQCKNCIKKRLRDYYYEDIEVSRLQGRIANEKNKVSRAMKRYGYKRGHEITCSHCQGMIKV